MEGNGRFSAVADAGGAGHGRPPGEGPRDAAAGPEVSASHGLINPEAEAWPEVESAVLRFAASLLATRPA
jgi:hypothetical protein